MGNKEKTISLYAENFLYGHITFDYGEMDDERFALAKSSADLATAFINWLKNEEKNDLSDEHKKETRELYRKIIVWRVRGRLTGIIHDHDLEQENKKLKDENMKLQLQNEELKQDTITALKELRDKNSLVEQYETSLGIRKS